MKRVMRRAVPIAAIIGSVACQPATQKRILVDIENPLPVQETPVKWEPVKQIVPSKCMKVKEFDEKHPEAVRKLFARCPKSWPDEKTRSCINNGLARIYRNKKSPLYHQQREMLIRSGTVIFDKTIQDSEFEVKVESVGREGVTFSIYAPVLCNPSPQVAPLGFSKEEDRIRFVQYGETSIPPFEKDFLGVTHGDCDNWSLVWKYIHGYNIKVEKIAHDTAILRYDERKFCNFPSKWAY